MAYTVAGAFLAFRENCVDLDAAKVKTARSSREYLSGRLKVIADSDPGFPRLAGGYRSFGSFARGTQVRPLDDIDLMFLLVGTGTMVWQPAGNPNDRWLKITDLNSPLASFPDDFGYVSSIKVLNRIKSGLSTIATYRKCEIQRNQQAVVLNLSSYDWSFDVVPAIPVAGVDTNPQYYLIPNGRGDWMRSDPRVDDRNVRDAVSRHGSMLRPVVRLLKYWNWRAHKPRLSSYHFETLILNTFRSAPSIVSLQTGIEYFFRHAQQSVIWTVADPKGLGPDLDAGVDWETKSKVQAAMKVAAEYSSYALMYESSSNHKDAISWWGRIFGPDFPSYG